LVATETTQNLSESNVAADTLRSVNCKIASFLSMQIWSLCMFILNPKSLIQAFSPSSSVIKKITRQGLTTRRTMMTTTMSDDERYLFDLNGYLIVRGVLTPEQVKEANIAIDKHADKMVERTDMALRNAVAGSKMWGAGPGRKDLGQVLEWGQDSKVFKTILAHPRLVPLFHGICGKGYRMDHLPFVLIQDVGAEGFQLHGGTIDCTSGEYNPHLAYTCHHGTIRTALLGCNVMLTDHNVGDGGFCVVPGSHKANFKMPAGMVDGQSYSDYIVQPATKAGDVVLFSEGTVHGAMPWTPENRQRRACLYRFSPATNVYGRSYFGHNGGGWPEKVYEDLIDAQRAVLEPPYANRLDRPNINDDGSVVVTTRDERKKQHDRDVFGTKYF
jgi:ectoine hydroxylase-related dioxygenase (phytanoyl-CoA dioxygenase family)